MTKLFTGLIVSCYCAILILASLPEKISDFVGLGSASTHAYKVLEAATIVPGLRLFYRPYDETLKVRHQCFHVKQFAADGSLRSQKSIGSGCVEGTSFKWNASNFEVMVFRLFEEAGMERLNDALSFGEEAWADTAKASLREKSLLAALGDFFCRKSEAQVGSLERIWVGWHRKWMNYDTNEISAGYLAVFKWSCYSDQDLEIEWYPHISRETIDEMAR